MNETPLYRILHACSDNEDATKLFFFSNLSPFVNNAIAYQLGEKRLQHLYNERYVTLIKKF